MNRWTKIVLVCASVVVLGGCMGYPMPGTGTAPAGCAPVRVLLAGDSLMKQAGPAITARFRALGYPVEVTNIAHGGSNAVEYSWAEPSPIPWLWVTPRDELAWWVANWHPQVIVTNWGTNKIDSMWGGPNAWLMDYVTDTAMADVVRIAGPGLYWATIPQRNDEYWQSLWSAHVNDKVLALATPKIDWRQATDATDDTAFQQYLQWVEDNQTRPVRTGDLLHLYNPDGIDRVARWTTAALASRACG